MLFNSVNELILTVITSLSVIWIVILTIVVFKSIKHYQNLVKLSNKENLQDILEALLKSQEVNTNGQKELEKKLQELKENSINHIQKIGFLRFNPFSDTGGNQSFIIALLNGNDSGVIISSLHSRSGPRWYVKKIDNGKGTEMNLNKEEEEALKNAQIINNSKKGETTGSA